MYYINVSGLRLSDGVIPVIFLYSRQRYMVDSKPNSFAIKLHKRIPDFVLHCAIMFYSAGLIIGGVIAGISSNQFILTLLGCAVVCFLISSCTSIITSIFPLFMKGKVNSGLIAGILNGFCYLGSSISSYGLGSIADNFGWIWVFWTLLFVCVAVCVGAGIYIFIKKQKTPNKK